MAGVRQFDEAVALGKAMTLFWEKGFTETSMQELAEVTGVQRGSLYHAYQGKDALFLRVFEVYKETFLAEARVALDQVTLRASMQRFFEFIIDSMTAGDPTRGCLSTKIALGSGVLDTSIRHALQDLLDGIEETLNARLARPEKEASLLIPPEEAASLVLTFTRGLVVIERVYRDKAKLVATADMFMRLLFGNGKHPPASTTLPRGRKRT